MKYRKPRGAELFWACKQGESVLWCAAYENILYRSVCGRLCSNDDDILLERE